MSIVLDIILWMCWTFWFVREVYILFIKQEIKPLDYFCVWLLYLAGAFL